MAGELMEPDWRGRVTRGATWLVAARLFDQLVRVVRLIVLARLLLPEAFGLLGVALVAIAFLQTFSETGVREALIQRDSVTRRELDAAWTLQLARGIALFAAGWLAAPWVGVFFESPETVGVLRWMMGAALIEGVGNVAWVRLQRTLSIPRQCLHQAAGSVVDLAVSVALALAWGDVRALIFGFLAGQLARLISGYAIAPYLPRLRFDLAALGELWSFGRWVLLSSVLLFLGNQGDDLVVGKLLGLPLLAAYQMAYRLASLPATEWSRLVTGLLFPLLSRLRDDRRRLVAAYREALQLSALGAFPVAAAIALCADALVPTLLGPEWAAVARPLQLLAFAGLARAIVGPGPLLMAIDRPQLKSASQALAVLVLGLTIVPLTLRFGLAGAATAAILRSVTGKVALLLFARRAIPELRGALFPAFVRPALFTAVAAVPSVALHRALFDASPWASLLLPPTLLLLLYVALTARLDPAARELIGRQWRTLRARRAGVNVS